MILRVMLILGILVLPSCGRVVGAAVGGVTGAVVGAL